MDREVAIEQWKKQVYDKQEDIDPSDERVWPDIAFGFFMAKGFDVEEADELCEVLVERGLH